VPTTEASYVRPPRAAPGASPAPSTVRRAHDLGRCRVRARPAAVSASSSTRRAVGPIPCSAASSVRGSRTPFLERFDAGFQAHASRTTGTTPGRHLVVRRRPSLVAGSRPWAPAEGSGPTGSRTGASGRCLCVRGGGYQDRVGGIDMSASSRSNAISAATYQRATRAHTCRQVRPTQGNDTRAALTRAHLIHIRTARDHRLGVGVG
jgi:hypothetical protein